MRLVIYEDNPADFHPLVDFRPVFDLRLGLTTIAGNNQSYFPRVPIDYLTREIFNLKGFKPRATTLYLSGRFVLFHKIPDLDQDTKLLCQGETVGIFKVKPPFPQDPGEIKDVAVSLKKTKEVKGVLLRHPWDMIAQNSKVLVHQFKARPRKNLRYKQISIIGDKKSLALAGNCRIDPFVVFDLSQGPVVIDQGAAIKSFSAIAGPSYIGRGTICDRAKITASVIGPHCRISGEVEASIFQGYANKQHEGFIGHSYIAEWVNLGALTTNSDLKNNYGTVRVITADQKIDTGLIKLGCFIGDHSKTGILTQIPTGGVIGSFVNFFGGGVMPRYVPSFRWLTQDKIQDYELEKAIRTAVMVMQRRNVKMSRHYEDLIRNLNKQ
jgi:UDP-N-acetylglucosamine diphosphorylase/glucosamine-1-phosphate N-acetyltransferase